jgi:hypothetical protein
MQDFLKSRSTDSLLWILRLATIMFAIYYTLSFGGAQSHATAYTRTLLAGILWDFESYVLIQPHRRMLFVYISDSVDFALIDNF